MQAKRPQILMSGANITKPTLRVGFVWIAAPF